MLVEPVVLLLLSLFWPALHETLLLRLAFLTLRRKSPFQNPPKVEVLVLEAHLGRASIAVLTLGLILHSLEAEAV